MNKHALELLEFPKVCQLVADRAASVLGRQKALALSPVDDRAMVESMLDHVRQLREIWIEGNEPGPVEVGLLDNLLSRLRIPGDLLEPTELIDLGKFMGVSTRIRRAIDRPEIAERFSDVHSLGLRFHDFGTIVRRLDKVFDPSGEFLDSASPRLAKIRRRLRSMRSEAGSALAELAKAESSHPEESFVTLREGRYVLAVRGQDRGHLKGIVHGRSKTGQTVFLEPLQAVERNNAISDLEASDQEERLAILRELSSTVQELEPLITESYEASSELDLLRAKTRLSLDLDCVVPSFNDDSSIRLTAARHPLLAAAGKSAAGEVVPLDLELEGSAGTLVLSGPNMGGKTVALKAVGLLCAMAQSGLHVSAGEGVDLPFTDSIYVDLGDDQSIEEETSTFAGHLQNIAKAYQGATKRSLVLLDELGGGTDPEEGTALGRALIELLNDRGCLVLVTTHLVGLKMIAHDHPRMRNAAMEFDPSTQRPTYRLSLGSPGRSRAFELARQILPPGEFLERAEQYRTRWAAHLDDLLGDLERKRGEMEQEIKQLKASQSEYLEAAGRRDKQADRLKKRLQAIREARLEAEGEKLIEAERLLLEAKRVRHEAARKGAADPESRSKTDEARNLEERIGSARQRLRKPRDRDHQPLATGTVEEGQPAWSHDLKSVVRIDSEPDATGKVWILHGTIRFLVPIESLGQVNDASSGAPARPTRDRVRGPVVEDTIEREIDIRGKTAAEGLEEIERYIDRAAVAGVPQVRIIHGKGKGILKREIEAFLSGSQLVESFRTGEPREGGWGVTIVTVRSAQVGA